uniref:Uncharacterized protein n=1 Tax=Avena sativa TaxID=4498 RepID=A0ACD5YKS9_AVESA
MKIAIFLVAIATTIYVAATPVTAIPGGWSNIKNITDPHIQELGKWAVMEHNKVDNDNLKFQKVVSGKQQIVNGVNYHLFIDAMRLEGSHGTYRAVLFEEDSSNPNTRKLISFNSKIWVMHG